MQRRIREIATLAKFIRKAISWTQKWGRWK